MIAKTMNPRAAYAGELLLTSERTESMDSWEFDGNILGPKILGDATGISSFWVVVAILVGGGFGGVLGMFLGNICPEY